MKNHTVLGSMSTETFLRKYWQKKPLLIRQAIPSMQPVVSREARLPPALPPAGYRLVQARAVVQHH
jgi:ribosomal protein L16 Arg81 hydroxylase